MKSKTTIPTFALCLVTLGSAWPPRAAIAAPTAVAHDPDAFDPYKPGAYLDGETFHIPAGASFAWQAWENPRQRVGAILVNDLSEQTWINIEHIELARPSEDPESLVLNQYTLTVHPDVPKDTILTVKTGGGTDTAHDSHWAFSFVMHIVPADKYMTVLKKLSQS